MDRSICRRCHRLRAKPGYTYCSTCQESLDAAARPKVRLAPAQAEAIVRAATAHRPVAMPEEPATAGAVSDDQSGSDSAASVA